MKEYEGDRSGKRIHKHSAMCREGLVENTGIHGHYILWKASRWMVWWISSCQHSQLQWLKNGNLQGERAFNVSNLGKHASILFDLMLNCNHSLLPLRERPCDVVSFLNTARAFVDLARALFCLASFGESLLMLRRWRGARFPASTKCNHVHAFYRLQGGEVS